MSLFPEIEFSPLFNERERRVITFIVHSIIREYQKKLYPFPAFVSHPIAKFTIQPHKPVGCIYKGYTEFKPDSIAILEWPLNMRGTLLTAYTGLIAHEIAHHIIQEYFGDNQIGNQAGLNLVHYAANSGKYQYTKRIWNIRFFFKYGIPELVISLFDVKKLVSEAWLITEDIKAGREPKGPHIYSV